MTTYPAIATAYYQSIVNDLDVTAAEHRAVEYWCAENDLTISEMLSAIEAASLSSEVA